MADNAVLINLALMDDTADGTLKYINKVQDGVDFRLNWECGIYFLFGSGIKRT